MKRLLSFIIVLGICCGFATGAESAEKKLALKDAIYHALKNNLDLQVQRTDSQLASKTLKINKSIFIPNLTLRFENSETNSPSTDFLSGAAVNTVKRLSLNVGVSENLPYGGNVSFSLYNLRYESNSVFSTVNPYLFSQANLSLTQPLLRNFGQVATKLQIYIAANDLKISKYQLSDNIIDLVFNVESAYWELVYAYQNLEARKMALQRAKDLLKQNEIKVKVGTLAPIEILNSKATVARNESQVLQAERTIQTREENLKRILNMSKEPSAIIPIDTPEVKIIPVDFNAFLLEALENRMDIKRAKLDLENYNIRVKYARNQMLPELQLVASYYTTGQGGEQLLYAPGASPLDPDFDPATDITGVIKKSIWNAMNEAFNNAYKNYSVALNFSMPLTFARQKAELAQAKINLKRSLLSLKNIENTVYSEVKEVIKELESNRKLVEADRIALELEGENLKAEERKLAVGLSTNFQVLTYQGQYADAQTLLLRSTINYILSLARINRILNRTFKAYDIKFSDFLEK